MSIRFPRMLIRAKEPTPGTGEDWMIEVVVWP